MDVAAWLRGLGLEQYAGLFRDNDIDGEILCGMTTEDLKELGISSFGHRRKLVNAIAALGGESPTRDVAQSAASATSAPTPSPSVDAERRQLTVMFCDLVGSTALSTRHDPEDLHELIGDYQRVVSEAVHRFDGFVAKYMGDGVLIYFGYPQAHEDDAERAVHGGLAVIEAVGKLLAREDLSVRLGIATGIAVVGDLIGEGAAQERGVVGETPNLAARLQVLAAPNTLIIGEATRRQVGRLFELEDLGPQQLAGFTEPQRAWRVIGESGEMNRFEALRSGETPLVGREEEVELLVRRWQQAKSGEGRVVLISGEPGIGKSRLTAALFEHIGREPHTRLRYFCSLHHQDSALYPFVAQLERAAGFARDDTTNARLGKLCALLAPGARDGDDIALLSELLSLPNTAADLNLSPQRKRDKLFEALLNQLEAEARHRPVLMVFEDAHWIDPTSRELLDLIVDRVRRLPVLLTITFRPEFQPPWGGLSHVTSLALNRLGDRAGETLVQILAGTAGLSAEMVAEIVERTDGVPLFVEELTKAVLESAGQGDRVAAVLATTSQTTLSVPATLHASLMARLDRLGPTAKEVAQIGAVLGREFNYELIDHIAERPDLDSALVQLTDAGLLFCRGAPPHSQYIFKHALVQDAAYSSLLRARRQDLHARVATILHDELGEIVASRPELLAHHYTEAGQRQDAVVYWRKAGLSSVARSALVEAVRQFQKGLGQVALQPDSPERQRQELDLRASLGSVLFAVKGHAGFEVGQAAARARELWEQAGSPSAFLHIPYGQARYHAHRGELELAQRLDQDLLRLSSQRHDSSGLVLGHYSFGRNLMLAGKFVSSATNLGEVLILYNPAQHRSLLLQVGDDPRVNAEALLGIVLFCLGYPDQALVRTRAAIVEAQGLAHPPSLAAALEFGTRMFSMVGDDDALHEGANQLVLLATEQGFADYHAQGTIFRGWAVVKRGLVEEGISLLRSGSHASRATGAEAWTPYHLALLAGAYEIAGQIDESATLLDEALQVADRTGEWWLAAELNRHKGRLLLRQGDCAAAEERFRSALSIAAEQQARIWELRAAVSLARLWAEQGRRAEARNLLAAVYDWFTEGFDTADLKEAKALLDELT